MRETWVIIPAYNEENRIKTVLQKVKEFTSNIVIIDDGSTDNTFQVAKKECKYVLRHKINLGKGSALKTGCDFALRFNPQKYILIDADDQHDPANIPLISNLLDSNDIVFTRRELNGDMPYIFRFGNWGMSFLIRILFGIVVNDSQSGYRGISSLAYKKIRWNSTDYSVETEMIMRVARKRLKFTEIPIKTVYHDRNKGTTVIDGLQVGFNMLKWKLLG